MKLSLQWLGRYAKIPANVTARELQHQLTMCTVEVEEVEHLHDRFERMVIGFVSEVRPHPKADRLRLAMTDIGTGTPLTIVCGGSNLVANQWVIVALPGAKVRWHGEGDLITLEPATIRGVASEGMICAANEIHLAELFPLKSEHEIVDLGAHAAALRLKPGLGIAEALGFADVLLTIDNKSLTNRPDLWSHYGMARELSAIYRTELLPLEVDTQVRVGNSQWKVSIVDRQRCFRYNAVEIRGYRPSESPLWLKQQLALLGQKAINLAVDLTNYVMFTVGQPTHVFDARRLSGRSIEVRRARPGERLKTLDNDREIELSSEDLVIADDQRALALAGVIGGADSAVGAETETLLLESASFAHTPVRLCAQRHGLRTESSMRFEKGLDPSGTETAIRLFVHLLRQIQPEVSVVGWEDSYPTPLRPVTVNTTLSFLSSRIGVACDRDMVEAILSRLGFSVSGSGDQVVVAVPSWRSTGDVSIAEDIVEEVARILGYDNIPFVAPEVKLTRAPHQPRWIARQRLRRYLAESAGMHEVVTYPWVEESFLRALAVTPEKCLQLSAPPSESSRFLQPTLLAGILGAVQRNERSFENFAIFQISRVFHPSAVSALSGRNESLPEQPTMLAIAIVGRDREAILARARGAVHGLLSALRFGASFDLRVAAEDRAPKWTIIGSSLDVVVDGVSYGALGLLSPRALREAGLSAQAVALVEINLESLLDLPRSLVQYKPVPEFPTVQSDLSVVVDRQVRWRDIEAVVRASDPLIADVRFLSQYEGPQIASGKRSVALEMTLSDPAATLTSERAQGVVGRVLKRLSASCGATLRE